MRYPRRCINLGTAAIVFLMLNGIACSQNSITESKKEIPMTLLSTYPVHYANSLRNSRVPVTSTAKGEIEWRTSFENSRPENIIRLKVWEDHVVLEMVSEFLVFAPDGKLLFSRPKRFNSMIAGRNGSLYYETGECYLNQLDLNNELKMEDAPLPAVANKDFRMTLFWPMEEQFIIAAFWPGHEPEEKPVAIWRNAVYGKVMAREGSEFRRMQKADPIFIPGLNRLVFGLDEIISVDVEDSEETSSFAWPVTQVADWCASPEGMLFISGMADGKKTVAAISLSGGKGWGCDDFPDNLPWTVNQPPAAFGDQGVYLFSGKDIYAVSNGKRQWQVTAQTDVTQGTSLADDSLLVSAGNELIYLSAAGKAVFSLVLSDHIRTAPVVDSRGHVYIATEKELVKIR